MDRPTPSPRTLPWTGIVGAIVVGLMALVCLGSIPYTFGEGGDGPRYGAGVLAEAREPPLGGFLIGSDHLGRSMAIRCLAGGAISLTVGIAAGLIAVGIGTLYGAIAGYIGGRVDAIMMRIVDVLYGLPYVLLVVLLAVAGDALLDQYQTRSDARAQWIDAEVRSFAALPASGDVEQWLIANPDERERLIARSLEVLPPRRLSDRSRLLLDVSMLLIAIGSVSWLTMSRVVRGQVMSLKNQPFVEAARSMGASPGRIFFRHLLPNLIGPIVVYATLTVPQAILQESFLSFLGIGIKPPLPSWGNLASDGLSELNVYRSHWWLLAFPCALLAITLLALNFLGEALREALDPRRSA